MPSMYKLFLICEPFSGSMKYYAIALLLFFSFTVQSQNVRPGEFNTLDSFVKEAGPMKDALLFDIVDSITKTCHDERTCTRAIYDWVAYNISYDCTGYHHKGLQNTNVTQILKYRIATAEGYALLFKAMCERCHITCNIISGYARNMGKNIGKSKKKPDHTWNAVNIRNQWYLVDACWAAGTTNAKKKEFYPKFNERYFFPDPERFAFTHYPVNRKWQLQDDPLTRSAFTWSPVPLADYINSDLVAVNQQKGVLRGKPGDCKRIILTVRNSTKVSELSLQYKDEPLLKKTSFYVVGNEIFFDLEMPKKGKYPVQLYLNSQPVMAFVCEVKKKKK